MTGHLRPAQLVHLPRDGKVARSWSWFDGRLVAICDKGHGMVVDPETVNRFGLRWPSLGCPQEGCGWHVFAEFGDWNGA